MAPVAPLHKQIQPAQTADLPGGPPSVDKWVQEDIRDEQMANNMNRRIQAFKPDMVDVIVAKAFKLPLPIYCEIPRVTLPGLVDPVTRRRQLCTRFYKKAACFIDYPATPADLEAKQRAFGQEQFKNFIYCWAMPGENCDDLEARLHERIKEHESTGAARPSAQSKKKRRPGSRK